MRFVFFITSGSCSLSHIIWGRVHAGLGELTQKLFITSAQFFFKIAHLLGASVIRPVDDPSQRLVIFAAEYGHMSCGVKRYCGDVFARHA